MFCVVYEFIVKEAHNEVFEKAWSEFTEAIHRVRGSLGSRLHTTNDLQKYVAYAQWPSEEAFNNIPPDDSYFPEELEARERMRMSLLESRTLYKLNMLADQLRRASPTSEAL